MEKFIVILRLLLKAAIYLKDFDDLYQRVRETTENTRSIRNIWVQFSQHVVTLYMNMVNIALSSFELKGTLWCVWVKFINEALHG